MNVLDNFKGLLFCLHTFGVRRSIDDLDSEIQNCCQCILGPYIFSFLFPSYFFPLYLPGSRGKKLHIWASETRQKRVFRARATSQISAAKKMYDSRKKKRIFHIFLLSIFLQGVKLEYSNRKNLYKFDWYLNMSLCKKYFLDFYIYAKRHNLKFLKGTETLRILFFYTE